MGYRCPCYKCTNRIPGCHSLCEAYIQWQIKEKTSKQRQKENADARAYTIDRIYRSRKRHQQSRYTSSGHMEEG